jgi:mono/diheme cytochrome c family protein
MNRAAKLSIVLGVPLVFAAVVVVSVMSYVLYEGPRMRMQPNVRTYMVEVPALPKGMVVASAPDGAPHSKAPSADAAAALANPELTAADSAAHGKVYYQYYCLFCHGEAGDGNGPVGESYVPKPADLRTSKITGYLDGQVLRAMLVGVGHEPVLEKVVPDEHRWPLVAYVRTLGASAQK